MAGAHVELGQVYTIKDPNPRSPTAVSQRRDTTVATRTKPAKASGRGATTTDSITGWTAMLIAAVRIPSHR